MSIHKILAALLLIGFFCLTEIGSANHSATDPYEAMCQLTGHFVDKQASIQSRAQNQGYTLVTVRGECGEKPNLLEIDRVMLYSAPRLEGANEIYELHTVTVWRSPLRKDGYYWECVLAKKYYLTKSGEVIKSEQDRREDAGMLEFTHGENIHSFTLVHLVEASAARPLAPDPRGPMYCQRADLEQVEPRELGLRGLREYEG